MSDGAIDEYIKFCGKALVGDAKEFIGIEGEIKDGLVGSEYERVLCVGGQIVGVSVEYLDAVMQRFEQRITASVRS
jgi:N-acetylneuraminic acid mutarotase